MYWCHVGVFGSGTSVGCVDRCVMDVLCVCWCLVVICDGAGDYFLPLVLAHNY